MKRIIFTVMLTILFASLVFATHKRENPVGPSTLRVSRMLFKAVSQDSTVFVLRGTAAKDTSGIFECFNDTAIWFYITGAADSIRVMAYAMVGRVTSAGTYYVTAVDSVNATAVGLWKFQPTDKTYRVSDIFIIFAAYGVNGATVKIPYAWIERDRH